MAEITLRGTPVPCPEQSPNRSPRSPKRLPSMIVLHSTGGGFHGAVAWMKNRESGVSAHFCLSRLGEAVQLVSMNEVAWHAGKSSYLHQAVANSVNQFAIGIEMEHFDYRQDWPIVQVDACADLCAAICHARGIDPKHIVGHRDVAPLRKVDPYEFPWDYFRPRVAMALAGLKKTT